MQTIFSSSAPVRPIVLEPSTEAAAYGLFALAMFLTVIGVFCGITFAPLLLSSGMLGLMLIVELGLIFTSFLWMRVYPLNITLFGLFPFLSGVTLTPYLMVILSAYVNGAAILANALIATVAVSGAAAVLVLVLHKDVSWMGRMLFLGLIGLVVMGVLQLFVPALRTGTAELALSGMGIVVFAGFTAYDLDRISRLGRVGANPFMLALSLYLDIFNLFLYLLRFISMFSGRRR